MKRNNFLIFILSILFFSCDTGLDDITKENSNWVYELRINPQEDIHLQGLLSQIRDVNLLYLTGQ
jgi:hypothetical protein